jgi:hypothetical protein
MTAEYVARGSFPNVVLAKARTHYPKTKLSCVLVTTDLRQTKSWGNGSWICASLVQDDQAPQFELSIKLSSSRFSSLVDLSP